MNRNLNPSFFFSVVKGSIRRGKEDKGEGVGFGFSSFAGDGLVRMD